MKFQSHVPNFIDADPVIKLKEFKDIEELLSDPWIKGWNEPPKKDFQYCWSPNEGKWSKAVLMIQWTREDSKKSWLVLGYMDIIPESLPQWEKLKEIMKEEK